MNRLEELKDRFNHNEKIKFIFFWGHTPVNEGAIDKSCFSQWYHAPFEENGIIYPTAEHYMMAKKALLFNDAAIHDKVLSASNAGEAKHLGRSIKNFNEDIWLTSRFDIVVNANVMKFGQNLPLKNYLLATGNRVLVEASPRDKIWGIGMDQNDPRCMNPNLWQGNNLLGFALMHAREILQE